MSESDNGRPPIPGMDQTAVQPTAQLATPQAQPEAGTAGDGTGAAGTGAGGPGGGAPGTPGAPGANGPEAPKEKKRHGHALRNAILGLCGGIVGALLVVFALNGMGFFANASGTSTTSSSTAGKTINIKNTDEATTAQAAAAKALPSVVVVNVTTSSGSGLGSGVIYDKKGDIITNYHVIEGATSISVTINNKSYDAKVVGSDSSSDIAVIKVDLGNTEVTPIEVGDSDKLVVGDWVMTVGSPFGLDQSVSAGIVSSLSRNQVMQSSSGETIYTNLIQTDAAINPGNSGGALVNSKGQLVGICTLFSSDTDSFAGIGFAIPGNYATKIADKIIAGKTVTHAYIGLSMQTVNSQNAKSNNLSVSEGAYVVEVTSGSPADKAGIKKGDIITAVDGEEITSADGMILAVRSHDIGDKIKVTFMRGNTKKTVEVTLGDDSALQKEESSSSSTTDINNTTNNNTNTNGDGSSGSGSQDQLLQEIYQYLQDNRGGSYSTTGTTSTTLSSKS
ncbi:MAG: S1C family serine protease [Parafannyhessea sp.]|uniref:S1C family serine protease n=1 Tax=Parafannyhessea sp. TaxID=2847324 RepID=UPI003F0C7CF5